MKKLHSVGGTTDLESLPVEELLVGIGKLGFRNWWLNEER